MVKLRTRLARPERHAASKSVHLVGDKSLVVEEVGKCADVQGEDVEEHNDLASGGGVYAAGGVLWGVYGGGEVLEHGFWEFGKGVLL